MPGTALSTLAETGPTEETPSRSDSSTPPPSATETSPAAEGLILPSAVQVRLGPAVEDDEEDRVTNPGPLNVAWQATHHEDDDARAAEDAPSLLHARPRRTAPWERPRSPEAVNERPAPIAQLDAPLFSDEVFVRPAAPRPARPAPRPTPAARRWLAWIVAGVVVLVLAAGWSALSADPSARTRRNERGDRVESARSR